MQTHSISEAQAHLPQLLEAVEHGEEIILTRSGRAIARIVQINQTQKLHKKENLISEQNETISQPGWVAKRLAALEEARELFGGLLSSSEEFAKNKQEEIAIEEKRFER